MKTLTTKCLALLLIVVCLAAMFAACTPEATPAVTIGFKTTDGAAEYAESIDAFEIGQVFYTCIKVKIVTDKKSTHNYKVVIEVPRTKDIEVDQTGGLEADSVNYLNDEEKTVLEFTIKGSKEAVEEKILFKGTPLSEGEAKISVSIYNEDGEKEGSSYFRIVEFKYELQ